MLTSLCSLSVTNKNRTQFLYKILPSLLTQRGVNYELVLINFHSDDDFKDTIYPEIYKYEDLFSPELLSVKCVNLKKDLRFNAAKAKNMGVHYSNYDSKFLALSDADVYLGMNYLYNHINKLKSVSDELAFSTCRMSDTKAKNCGRIEPEVNYGNLVCRRDHFYNVGGFNESREFYGGDDTDLFHRMNLYGLRELNPVNVNDACQYSIPHSDELRVCNFKNKEKVDVDKELHNIYSNHEFYNKSFSYLHNLYECIDAEVMHIFRKY